MTTAKLPQVDKVLRHETLILLEHKIRHQFLAELVRFELSALRKLPVNSCMDVDVELIALRVRDRVMELLQPQLRRVINATGVVLSTNLGRSPLASQSLFDLQELGAAYCNLEIDLNTGKRGNRCPNIETLLKLIVGCESALVVNNNAAAVLLAISALSRDKEVVVSRGELIEIGGSFRLPDVIQAAGGILKEVGTTNRTRIADFSKAIGKQTGLLMRCHPSNFEIRGFTEGVKLEELTLLSRQRGIPLLEDLGSGLLVDLSLPQMKKEPTVRQVVSSKCDLITFSGDKLLGGPQAGFIVGKKEIVERLGKDPVYRALRVDKLTLALIERTLIAYLSASPEQEIPVLSMLTTAASKIKERAENFVHTISGAESNLACKAVPTDAAAGGGSLPGETLSSWGVVINIASIKPNRLAEHLRKSNPPVIGIIEKDELVLDFRTVSVAEEKELANIVLSLSRQLA